MIWYDVPQVQLQKMNLKLVEYKEVILGNKVIKIQL